MCSYEFLLKHALISCSGLPKTVPRPGQVLSETMQRPGMHFCRTQYVVALAIVLLQKQKVKLYLKHQQI